MYVTFLYASNLVKYLLNRFEHINTEKFVCNKRLYSPYLAKHIYDVYILKY